ncbi:NAD(P)/FAD-dependent oxidoreductase [Jannaschia formosa]|uniref:NAD(P)/FAD-dependent oxidoreductase n=1 Tax=Jannaschia formosa TaxID=2259592 RepID=UPI000E1BDDD5|nr:FAD-binding oxidoreductase [Jannaschia formosa]TFL19371.1 FAD-binding oxidoreductase [Jannaschia formosa]
MRDRYDVVIVGGAIMGSSTAWWLTELGFDGSILVVERDPSYAKAATTHTNSCIRQQYSEALNVRISQFAAEFIESLPERMGDPAAPRLKIRNFGYLYLADSPGFADILRQNAAVQRACGTPTRLLTADEIAAEWPFYDLDGILLGSHNTQGEGLWDGQAVFDAWRRGARARGVTFLEDEVTGLEMARTRVEGLRLASGRRVACGAIVNAAGTRGAAICAMAGIALPVEPRRRFTWVFRAERPLDRDLPLTIDPSGFHVRENGGGTYMAGGHAEIDPAVDPDDFAMDHGFWQDHAWPVIATRIPAFESVKVISEWVGHYDYNSFDQNAIIGPHPEVTNFHLMNGFSGHGLQQSPAMGRAMAELLVHGSYRSLDLSPFGYERLVTDTPILERAVI